LKCLETNVFINEKQDGAGPDAIENPFLPIFFNRTPQLRAIILHGRKAQAGFRALKDKHQIKFNAELIEAKHFCRCSYDYIDGLVRKIKTLEAS